MKRRTNRPTIDMDPIEIWIAMQRAGVGQKDIGDALGVTRQAVHHVIQGRFVSHRIRQAISEAIGIDLKQLWPSTYLYKDGPGRPGRP
jgi:lambda repressor-like predicted transcriptional regulator